MQNIKNSVGLVKSEKIKFNQKFYLENGSILSSFELMIETYGKLNFNKTNAVLICHALSGNHHVAGFYNENDKYPGWWDNMVGPNKPIDTNKFFVVGLNNLGGCDGSTGPTSINQDTNMVYGSNFPIVTVKDWVNSQVLLTAYLGISKWAAIIGGSLGGMQALQWSIDYPNMLKNTILIATAPKLSAQNIAFNDVARQAILNDANFNHGNYISKNTKPKKGLRIARMMGHITYLAEQGLGLKFGRCLKNNELKYNYNDEFEVESYLRYQGDKFSENFDGNTYLLMTKALDYFDPAKDFNDNLQLALSEVQSNFLIVSFNSDWKFPPSRSKEIIRALVRSNKKVQYIEINSLFGHDAFLMQDKDYVEALKIYMQNIIV